MIVRRDEKLVDVPLRLAEAEIAAGKAEAVSDYSGIKETDISEDRRYGLVRDPIDMKVQAQPTDGFWYTFTALDAGGVPIAPSRPLSALALADARDHAARQAELGVQVFAGKPIPPTTDGSEAIPESGGVLGRGPVTLQPGPRPARRRSNV
jgi:hypothetical protein